MYMQVAGIPSHDTHAARRHFRNDESALRNPASSSDTLAAHVCSYARSQA